MCNIEKDYLELAGPLGVTVDGDILRISRMSMRGLHGAMQLLLREIVPMTPQSSQWSSWLLSLAATVVAVASIVAVGVG